MNVMMWNMCGFENNREFLLEMRDKQNIHVCGLCETWKHNNLNIYR